LCRCDDRQVTLLKKDHEDFYQQAVRQIEEIKVANPELSDVFDLYDSILTAQREISLSFQPDVRGFDAEACVSRSSNGLPLLKAEDVSIDRILLNGLLVNLCRIVQKRRGDAIPADFEVAFLSDQESLLVKGVIENGAILQEMAVEAKIEYDVFQLLAEQAVSPFISRFAEELAERVDQSKWLRGYCPICGKEPIMSKLEQEIGKRWLFCSFCHTEWLFKRLVCPFCENDNQESLRYFFVENDEAHRVDVCDRCKRYIKTLDSRQMNSGINLFVENLSSLALDIVAEKEGFHNSSRLP